MKQIHEDQEILERGLKLEEAEKAVILLHGRGASAGSMANLADQLPEAAYLIPRAKERTWYPNPFTFPREDNQPYLDSALNTVEKLVERAAEQVGNRNVLVGGFSQGACLASTFLAESPAKYGGGLVFSGGLIGDDLPEYEGSLDGTPIYLGCSESDPHIAKTRVNKTEEVLEELDAEVEKQFFRGDKHAIFETG